MLSREMFRRLIYVLLVGIGASGCGQGFVQSNSAGGSLSQALSLTVTPASSYLLINSTKQFTASGGNPPYTYRISNGSVAGRMGTIDASTGVYLAPSVAGASVEIVAQDASGAIGAATVTISDILSINPASRTVVVGNTIPFTMLGSGGIPPYTYAIETGSGTISSSGIFVPPSTPGTSVIRVTDAAGDFRMGVITIQPALSVFPPNNSRTVAVGGTLALTALGGLAPYTYTLISGSGNMNGATFYAPATNVGTGVAVIRVGDSTGAVVDVNITIISASGLAITPANRYIATLPSGASPSSSLFSWTVTGGVQPYSYSIVSGPGSIDVGSGFYTPPNDGSANQRTTIIRVTDAQGSSRDATIVVQPVINASPGDVTIPAGTQIRIDGYGGVAPFTYTIVSGGGTLTQVGSTGSNYGQSGVAMNYAFFVAPNTAGATVVQVSDSFNMTKELTITVTGTATGPTEPSFTLTPATRIVAASATSATNPVPATYFYTASGGVPPYTYSLQSGPGTLSSTTGAYNPPADSGTTLRTAVVRATDSIGAYRDATIFIQPALDVVTTPYGLGLTGLLTDFTLPSTTRNRTIAVNQQFRIDGTGGLCQLTQSIISGGGMLQMVTLTTNNYAQVAVNCAFAIFTAPATAGTTVIRTSDTQGNWVDSTITVVDNSLGAPDTGYGTSGVTTFGFGTADDFATAQAIDSSGRLVVVGSTYNTGSGNYDFAVARLTTAGALDATFGGMGGAGSGRSIVAVGTGHDFATAVAIQADGKILIAGDCLNGGTYIDFCVVRLDANGTALDTAAFNAPDGFLITNAITGNVRDGATAIALQADGKPVIGGTCQSAATGTDFCAIRLTTAGILDVTFNTTGIVNIALAGADQLQTLAIDAVGRILFGGICTTDFCISRYAAAGTVDTSFGSAATGRVTFVAGANWNITEATLSMQLQTDGKITFGGSAITTTGSLYAYVYGRLNYDGGYDETFGVDGRMSFEYSPYTGGTAGTQGVDVLNAIALQSNGRIVGVGRTLGSRLTFDYGLIRSRADGSLDLDFGSAGRMAIASSGNSNLKAVSVQADGRIVSSGYNHNGTNYDFAVLRVQP